MTNNNEIVSSYELESSLKESIEEAHEQILADFGKCDILINGAGGNNARANTDNEFFKNENFFELLPENDQREFLNQTRNNYLKINKISRNYYDILYKNDKQIIDNNTLAALTLLIAESNPKEKNIIVDLVMNFLCN